jgi:rare lipoprotein A
MHRNLHLMITLCLLIGAGVMTFLPVVREGARADQACASEAPIEGTVQRGEASWYGKAHHGKKTASGERFDANAATAAHPTLPLGTEIEVTNLETGRETRLTVNDRGPTVEGRVLDVSKKAAQDLGFVEDGTAQVEIEPKPPAQAEKPKC